MDIFKFTNPTESMKMEQGLIINGLKRKTWIERYTNSGEFTLIADVKSGMKDILPIGTFISHIDSTEIMMVENHEIKDEEDQNSEIVITGRGFEAFFENRIVGSNRLFPISDGTSEYVLPADYLVNQIVTLIKKHVLLGEVTDPGDAIPYLEVIAGFTPSGENVARSIKRGPLYSRVLDLLAVGGYGIKVVRPGPWSPVITDANVGVVIHVGADKSSEIVFSQDTGEIQSSEYLWSNKQSKNAALITGRWVQTSIVPAATGIDRRWMEVEADDIDNGYSAAPTGAALANVEAAMKRRGHEAISSQGDVALTRADVFPDSSKATYRKDFDVGDILTINGSYNETSSMRVSEYVEIEDESGTSGAPTLTVV